MSKKKIAVRERDVMDWNPTVDNQVIRRLTVALVPIDCMLQQMHQEVEDGYRSIKDPLFIKGLKLRRKLIHLLERAEAEEYC